MIFLGTGASEGIPNPFCRCRICETARKMGGKECDLAVAIASTVSAIPRKRMPMRRKLRTDLMRAPGFKAYCDKRKRLFSGSLHRVYGPVGENGKLPSRIVL